MLHDRLQRAECASTSARVPTPAAWDGARGGGSRGNMGSADRATRRSYHSGGDGESSLMKGDRDGNYLIRTHCNSEASPATPST